MKKIILFLIILAGWLLFSCDKDDTEPDANTFIDARDGQRYHWVLLNDGKTWMADNLNYTAAGSWCYDNKENSCDDYGRLYNWASALTACPEGWHLPSDTEWQTMTETYGELNVLGSDAYAVLIDGGSSGFDALLGGSKNSGIYGIYHGEGIYGHYWSSTLDMPEFPIGYTFNKPHRKLTRSTIVEYLFYSCRCVKN